ncbi:hypothetical protein LCGC14_2253910, partial [marine sediment metagenome]
PIVIITSIQVAPDGASPEIIRTGTMIAELNQDLITAPTLEPAANILRPGLTRDIQTKHTATASEIMLVRSLKGDSASGRPPAPMSRTV